VMKLCVGDEVVCRWEHERVTDKIGSVFVSVRLCLRTG
jgi:hypothetical protein